MFSRQRRDSVPPSERPADAQRQTGSDQMFIAGSIAKAMQSLHQVSREMTQRLEEAMRGTAKARERAREQPARLREAAGGVSSLSQAFSQVAVGAAQQAETTASAMTTLQQVSYDADVAAGRTQDLSQWISDGTQRVETGHRAVTEVLQTAQGFAEAMARVQSQIEALRESAAGINAISENILDIAEQTNLLSLNASIEAARAGQHGRGFAVVAEAVRKLADQSKKQVSETSGRLQRIHEALSNVSQEVGGVAASAQQVAGSAQEAEVTLSTMVDLLQGARDQVSFLGDSFSSLVQRISNVSSEIGSVAAVSQENAAIAEEVTAGVEEVQRSMQSIAQISAMDAQATDEVDDHLAALTTSAQRFSTTSAILRRMAEDVSFAVRGAERSPIALLVQDGRRYAASISAVMQRVPIARYTATAYEEISSRADILSLGRLFDVSRVTRFDPPKFRSPWDQEIDEEICRICDDIYRGAPATNTIAIADLNGFVFVEEMMHRKDWTGDPNLDLSGNRVKRLFDDAFGLETARVGLTEVAKVLPQRTPFDELWQYARPMSEQPFSIHVYQRDTGEILLEVDAPLYAHDLPVGSFRWILNVDDDGQIAR